MTVAGGAAGGVGVRWVVGVRSGVARRGHGTSGGTQSGHEGTAGWRRGLALDIRVEIRVRKRVMLLMNAVGRS